MGLFGKGALAFAGVLLPLVATSGAGLAQDASSSAAASASAAPAAITGDATAGATVFNKCKACHAIGAGATNRTGPVLTGVVGRQPGTYEGYNYSAAMKKFGTEHPAWTPEELSNFLHGPMKYIPGTKMTFAGIQNQTDIDNLIAYLASQTAS